MTVYQYIAEANPDAAYEVCKKHGYFDVKNLDELSLSLQQIIAQGGEPAFEQVMQLHPDAEVIIELYKNKSTLNNPVMVEVEKKEPCACSKKSADGVSGITMSPTPIVSQTNLYILVGALMVTFAVISLSGRSRG